MKVLGLEEPESDCELCDDVLRDLSTDEPRDPEPTTECELLRL